MGLTFYRLLDPIGVAAVEDLTFDFDTWPEIQAGQTIASATWSYTRADGGALDLQTTVAPGGVLAFSGSQVTLSKLAGGTVSVEYLLKVSVVTSAGKTLISFFKLSLTGW